MAWESGTFFSPLPPSFTSLSLAVSLFYNFFSRSNPPLIHPLTLPSSFLCLTVFPMSQGFSLTPDIRFYFSQSSSFLTRPPFLSSFFFNLFRHIDNAYIHLCSLPIPCINPCWKCPLTLLCLFIPPSPPSLPPSKQSVLWSSARNKHHTLCRTHMHTADSIWRTIAHRLRAEFL